jgi:hypothetical protein
MEGGHALSQLPSLYHGANSRLARARERSSSNVSSASDISAMTDGSSSLDISPGDIRKLSNISYMFEKRTTASQDVLRQHQRLQRMHILALAEIAESKSQIIDAMKREKTHTEAVRQECEARRQGIVETFEVLRSVAPKHESTAQPPSISQLRQIANAILTEALRFKARSEQSPGRIEKELRGAQSVNQASLFELQGAPGPMAPVEKLLSYQIGRLSHFVLKKEDSKLKLETTRANRDMLHRVIFDHKTALEALKVKKAELLEESRTLSDEYDRVLADAAHELGEVAWKNAVLTSCNQIASLTKG